jgi:hypothetical protein
VLGQVQRFRWDRRPALALGLGGTPSVDGG